MTLPAKIRRQANRRGRFAELIAAAYMLVHGYRILALRYKTKLGEVDLIARRGKVIAFVEVKSRKNVQLALDAITVESQRRIRNAGDLWMGHRKDAAELSARFDVIAVCPWKFPIHLVNAF